MIRSIIRNARLARGTGSTVGAKFSIFFSLIRVGFKSRYFNQKNKECSESFFNYRVWGFDYATLDYLFREVFLSKEYSFATTTAEPVIIDCGSNIGMSILYFKDLFPKAKISGFEANPHTYNLLKKNVETNNLKEVELYNTALSDHNGEISFFISENIGTLVGSTRSDRGGSTELKCTASKLSDHIKNFERIDLIKMDVEGSEHLIIKDLFESSCMKKADQFLVEYHHHINNDPSMLADFLKKFEMSGFDYSLKAGFRTLGSFQDILIHFYKRK